MPPPPCDVAARWRELSEEIMAGIEAWRRHPPKATLQEIDAAVDGRLAERRTRRLPDGALASRAADVRQASGSDRPVCANGGRPAEPRGPRERQLTTPQGKSLRLRRSSAVGPTGQVGFFPVEEELAWQPGQLTPQWHESLVQRGPWLPFAPVAEALAFFTGVPEGTGGDHSAGESERSGETAAAR
jgi:hypothetical protein